MSPKAGEIAVKLSRFGERKAHISEKRNRRLPLRNRFATSDEFSGMKRKQGLGIVMPVMGQECIEDSAATAARAGWWLDANGTATAERARPGTIADAKLPPNGVPPDAAPARSLGP